MHPKTLISIDYLIINLKGDLNQNSSINSSNFELYKEPFATKIFSDKYIVKYQGESLGIMFASPRSSIISADLIQLQFENHIFYTKSLLEIRNIIDLFTDEYKLTFSAINRLDIAVDIQNSSAYFRKLTNNILNNKVLLSGRKKSFSTHNELVKGVCISNGFNLGSRTSAKFLRVYNKTLSLEIKEKQYIIDYYKQNHFDASDVWRFEFQLNAQFFSDLKNYGHDKDFFQTTGEKLVLPFEDVTNAIFDYSALCNLLIMAKTNFFELRKNTGKSQINKEKKIDFIIDFDYLLENISEYKPTFVRLKSTYTPDMIKKKRLAKALFREYIANFQNVTYIVALNRLLDCRNPITNEPLSKWFDEKMRFYLTEFRQLEKMKVKFDAGLFNEQRMLFIE